MNVQGFRDIVFNEYPSEIPLHSNEGMNKAVLERNQTWFRIYSPI